MRKAAVLMTVVAGGVLAMAGWARTEQPNAVSAFMRMKLSHSQKVLEGLALEDYDSLAKHSQELSLLSQAASWQVLQTEEYLMYSNEFRRAADELTAAAKKRNLDGAALAYVEVTMKCVNCHKYVRGVRMASIDGPAASSGRAAPEAR